MKIITKEKDYYDYCVGRYGIDPLIVLDRTSSNIRRVSIEENHHDRERPHIMHTDDFTNRVYGHRWSPQRITVAIAGVGYTVLFYDGKFYHSLEDLQELDALLHERAETNHKTRRHGVCKISHFYNEPQRIKDWHAKANGFSLDINKELREPVLMSTVYDIFREDVRRRYMSDSAKTTDYKWIPIYLKDMGFPRWYTAEDMFRQIYAFQSWLKDHPPIPDKMTNKEKILSHGFDLKKSFRHRKA